MNPKRFISRDIRYAVKTLANGALRAYIKNSQALSDADFTAGSRINVVYKRNRIEVRLDPNGKNTIMNTGRGALLELKNKDTAKALGAAEFINVTFRRGVVVITVHGLTEKQQRREASTLKKIVNGEPLRKACFFSGLGMLSLSISQGLEKQGIRTQIAFANDNNELAMSCNLQGNPMWDNATDDAHVVIDDLHALNIDGLPEVDMVTIGYPCVGFSKLAAIENKDLLHPQCGALLIPLVAALRQMNPTFFIIENTPCFATSQTLALIQKALPDYNFEQTVLDGHDFNELESRKRACVVATSKGLPRFDVTKINSIYADMEPPKVGDYLEDIPLDSPVWREMAHVKARDTMDNVNFKNHVYYGDENKMVTLPASYSSPKAGTPMIGHPVDMKLQRQVQVDEHSNLRCLPLKLKDVILEVWLGINSLVSAKGSASAAHRLLGNGVSKKVWNSVGDSFGRYLNYIAPTASY